MIITSNKMCYIRIKGKIEISSYLINKYTSTKERTEENKNENYVKPAEEFEKIP